MPNSIKVGDLKYTLLSSVVHLGPTRNNGHYVSVASCPGGSWTMFDDEKVGTIVFLLVLHCNSPLLILFFCLGN